MVTCNPQNQDRRKPFWTTQQCGTYQNSCGDTCGNYGLPLVSPQEACEAPAVPCLHSVDPTCLDEVSRERQISTAQWVQGLIYNILLTDGRMPDTACGYRPGARGGHWSDSFRKDGLTAGSLLRTLGTFGRINDQINLARAYAQADMQKLVKMKIAESVDVKATYGGGRNINLDIIVYGRGGAITKVGLTGSPTGNEWRWVDV